MPAYFNFLFLEANTIAQNAEGTKNLEQMPMEEQIRFIITELSQLDESYFGKDRQKQIKGRIESAISLLDKKPIDLV